MRTYESLLDNLYQIKVHDNTADYYYETYISQLSDLSFLKDHLHYYPQNIFIQNTDLDIYFITNTSIHCLNLNETGIAIKSIDLKCIDSIQLEIHGYLKVTLTLQVSNGEPIVFDNNLDAGIDAWKKTLYEPIIKIYTYLVNR